MLRRIIFLQFYYYVIRTSTKLMSFTLLFINNDLYYKNIVNSCPTKVSTNKKKVIKN